MFDIPTYAVHSDFIQSKLADDPYWLASQQN